MSKEVYNSLCHFVSDCQAFFRNCTANVDVPGLLQVNVVQVIGVSIGIYHLCFQQALHDTKIQIRRYLSDDFNTAQATNAVRQLMSLTNQEMKKTNTSGSGSGAEAVVAVSNFVVDYFDSMGFDLMVVRFMACVIGTCKRAFFMYHRVVQRAIRMWSLMQS